MLQRFCMAYRAAEQNNDGILIMLFNPLDRFFCIPPRQMFVAKYDIELMVLQKFVQFLFSFCPFILKVETSFFQHIDAQLHVWYTVFNEQYSQCILCIHFRRWFVPAMVIWFHTGLGVWREIGLLTLTQ